MRLFYFLSFWKTPAALPEMERYAQGSHVFPPPLGLPQRGREDATAYVV
jgi:hypothetical protein